MKTVTIIILAVLAGFAIGNAASAGANTEPVQTEQVKQEKKQCSPDLNNDGKVDVFDLSMLLGAWSQK